MTEFQKVLVVDDGTRTPDHALSAELAELGYASVTTSLEATDDVLELIPSPAAILLQLPHRSESEHYSQFLDLADRLRRKVRNAGVPVILVDRCFGSTGGFSAAFESQVGSRMLHKPEL